MFLLLLAVLGSYLIGSIPFGFLIAKLVAGVDIRTVGSGNIGATNVGRTIGWHWFFVVLVLDLLKGLGPALASAWWMVPQGGLELSATDTIIFSGLAAMLGHLYPCYLYFRGGKGMATGLGIVIALALETTWWPVIAALATFLILVGLWRMISLGSMVAAAVYGITLLFTTEQTFRADGITLTVFGIIVPVLVIWKHRGNIVRILHGEEPKLGQKKSGDAEENPAAANAT